MRVWLWRLKEGCFADWLFSQVKNDGLMLAEIGVEVLIATHQCKHSYLECVWASIMSVSQHLHIKADVCFASYCHKVVKHQFIKKKKKKRHLGNIKDLLQVGLEKTDKLLAVLDISSGSKMQCFPDSSFPDETAVQWTVSTCCELWKRMRLNPHNSLVKSLFFTHHCRIEIFMYKALESGVYVHINLISLRLWILWHARGIKPQAVSVVLRYMNHTVLKKHALYSIYYCNYYYLI